MVLSGSENELVNMGRERENYRTKDRTIRRETIEGELLTTKYSTVLARARTVREHAGVL